MEQRIIQGRGSHRQIERVLSEIGTKKYMLVCGGSFARLGIDDAFRQYTAERVTFQGFSPNPRYEDIMEGVARFTGEGCDAIVAVGGGSAMDVAKCIKLFCKLDPTQNYLQQAYSQSEIPMVAIPTTAGTGSESTCFAVIYYRGEKQSVTHASIVPDYAILDSSLLASLPLEQKKSAMLDALSQAVESWWSVNSTDASKRFARSSIEGITANMEAYLRGGHDAADAILLAANNAGRAINITQTTAPHAMAYKLTSLYGLPHGRAVAVCLPHVWQYMCTHGERCIDSRGEGYLFDVFADIAHALGYESAQSAITGLRALLRKLAMEIDVHPTQAELDTLAASVNTTRLRNNPVALDPEALRKLYCDITGNSGVKEKK